MAYKTEVGMAEMLPHRITVNGAEYEVDCYHNYMGQGRCGIAPVGALDEVLIPASMNRNGSTVRAQLVRAVPFRAAQVYIATFAVNFCDHTVSYAKEGIEPSAEQSALLEAFIAAVFTDQSEVLACVPITAPTKSPSLSEMVTSANSRHIAAGSPRGTHLEYLGDDYDDL
jgi:hypothetical protein